MIEPGPLLALLAEKQTEVMGLREALAKARAEVARLEQAAADRPAAHDA
jgi:hypothetical protein